jgi:hypothetical protein
MNLEQNSVLDPDVFGPPGSGSIIDLYGSESGSFHQQAQMKKNLESTVL